MFVFCSRISSVSSAPLITKFNKLVKTQRVNIAFVSRYHTEMSVKTLFFCNIRVYFHTASVHLTKVEFQTQTVDNFSRIIVLIVKFNVFTRTTVMGYCISVLLYIDCKRSNFQSML